MTESTLGILIAEDDADLRAIVSDYLSHCGYEVWAARDGEQALALAQGHAVDIALVDVVMPGLSGIELIPQLQALQPGIAIILMTAYGTVPQAVEAMRLGAFEYLEKPLQLQHMREVVERAAKEKQTAILGSLTQREQEVLQLLAEGKTDVEIAETLHLSKYTIGTHVRNILTKLNIENRVQAAVRWDRWMRGKDR